MELKYYDNKITVELNINRRCTQKNKKKRDFCLTLTVTFPSEMLLPNGIL